MRTRKHKATKLHNIIIPCKTVVYRHSLRSYESSGLMVGVEKTANSYVHMIATDIESSSVYLHIMKAKAHKGI